jgi:hypothetical protein
MDDAALLEPYIDEALQAAALTKDREAPLKRDMMIYNGQSTKCQFGIDQWHSPPRPNNLALMRENTKSSVGRLEFPAAATIRNPATSAASRTAVFLAIVSPKLSFFPLYTTNAEGMIRLYDRCSSGLRAGDVVMSRAHITTQLRDNVNISDPFI